MLAVIVTKLMKVNWKRLVLEIILGVMMELSPNYLDKLATITEYLVDLSINTATIQIVFPKVSQQYVYGLHRMAKIKFAASPLIS